MGVARTRKEVGLGGGIRARAPRPRALFLFIVSSGAAMPYFVQGVLDDHILTSATDTAKKAFSAAIEWHIVRGFGDVSISDGVGSYSIAEFASMMALQEIAESVEGERTSRS